ncbi:MAG: hypothetical protein HXY23_04910 [Parvularculaceae bacterium]|jgi:hypothetical protein|nr:hypothetical protein [Parvularculaceae bacterium]
MANITFTTHLPADTRLPALQRQLGAAAGFILMAIVAGSIGVAGAIATFGF